MTNIGLTYMVGMFCRVAALCSSVVDMWTVQPSLLCSSSTRLRYDLADDHVHNAVL